MHFMQIVLIFLSFATILFWLFELGGATFIQPFAPLFHFIEDVTHLFYNRTVQVEEVQIDFAFLIAAITFLLIVWGLKFAIEALEELEKKYDYFHEKFRVSSEKSFNVNLERQYVKAESKINKFLVLVKFKARNMARDSFFEKGANEGAEEQETGTLNLFAEKIDKALGAQKRILSEGVLLYFEDFKRIDKIISTIKDVVDEIKGDYSELNWEIKEVISIEPYAYDSEITYKIRNLMLLNRLDFKGEIVCLSEFKHRYSLVHEPKYTIENKGVFEINKDEDVFCIKNL